jgi:DNA-binding response OmpR family regulator
MRSETVQKLAAFCEGKNIRCAIVENDEPLRNIIARVLRDLGMDVSDTGDGWQMVQWHHQQPFDLAILHWFNRGLNGERILEEIKALDDQMPKVIIMTGQEAVSMHSPVPVAGFLFKPFDLNDLSRVVLDAIGGSDACS